LLVIAGIAGGGGDGNESDSAATSEVPESTGAEDVEAPEPTDGPEETESTEAPEVTEAPVETDAAVVTDPPTSGDAVAGAPDGAKGGRSDRVPGGALADIGDGLWLQVVSVTDDATALVLAENQFNEPPPEGSRFTLVEVALGYYGFDDPQSGFLTSIQGVGSENTELITDCGVTQSDLNHVTTRPARRSGTRSNTDCSRSSPPTGAVSPSPTCAPSSN